MEGVEEEVHSGASVGVVEWCGELWSIMWLGWRSGGGVVEEGWMSGGGLVVQSPAEGGGWFFDGSKIMSNNFDQIWFWYCFLLSRRHVDGNIKEIFYIITHTVDMSTVILQYFVVCVWRDVLNFHENFGGFIPVDMSTVK